jgi:hypothetical protein
MPTTGSAAAFTKVVEARNELSRIAEELNAARRDTDASPAEANVVELQKRHHRARRVLELAIDVFSATLKNGNGK